jgi:hypothetical protein
LFRLEEEIAATAAVVTSKQVGVDTYPNDCDGFSRLYPPGWSSIRSRGIIVELNQYGCSGHGGVLVKLPGDAAAFLQEELPEDPSKDTQTIVLASIALSRTTQDAESLCVVNEDLLASVFVEVSPIVSGRGCLL